MDNLQFYVKIDTSGRTPFASMKEIKTGECPKGDAHKPETVEDELTTEFWGDPQTIKFDLTTCKNCGQVCEPKEAE